MMNQPRSVSDGGLRKSSWSFSLRTLLVLITLSAVAFSYVGYQLSVVRARRALLNELSAAGYQVTTQDEASHAMQAMQQADEPDPSVPLIRGWLGDEAIATIGYYPHLSPQGDRQQRIKTLLPEARLVEFAPPLEPCHPGCFPRGTLVETPSGPRPIEAIAVGDAVYSVLPDGSRISLPVMSIFRTTNRLWIVKTSRGELRTTETQPLCVAFDKTVEAGKLQPGDVILAWSSESPADGEVVAAEVTGKISTDDIVPVINLVLGNRQPFIAGGFLARSKPPRDGIAAEAITKHHHSHE